MSLTRTVRALAVAAAVSLLAFVPGATHRIMADEVMVHMISQCNGDSCQLSFLPARITIPVGSTIDFMNLTTMNHTATSDTGVFDTGTLGAEGVKSITFSTPGAYPYHCAYHPDMHGVIVVAGPTSTPAPPTATSTPAPIATPLPTAAPALTVVAKLTPRHVPPGHRIRLTVRTLPGAALSITVARSGARPVRRHATAGQNGSYATAITVGRGAQRGKLTVRVTSRLGTQTARATASATID